VPGAGHLVARDAPAELARILSAHVPPWLAAADVLHHAFERGADQLDHLYTTSSATTRRRWSTSTEPATAGGRTRSWVGRRYP